MQTAARETLDISKETAATQPMYGFDDPATRDFGEILRAVDRTGSIKQAAAEMGKNYRHVWARIKEADAARGGTLVETRYVIGLPPTRCRAAGTCAVPQFLRDAG
jgi:hypothetical protein